MSSASSESQDKLNNDEQLGTIDSTSTVASETKNEDKQTAASTSKAASEASTEKSVLAEEEAGVFAVFDGVLLSGENDSVSYNNINQVLKLKH
ncbi:hypothetical protein GIX45_10405 [Erwinia sp. CPCC 100877]|nr:hypothetical protein [Erwinia sp. CPCC 100877]